MNMTIIASVMIYHCGASLSEQHTDLLIGHIVQSKICVAQVDYAAKSSPEIVTRDHSTTFVIEICTACGQPAIDDL